MKKNALKVLLGIFIFIIVLTFWVHHLNYYPAPIEKLPVYKVSDAKPLPKNRFKILSWNVQYMASKNYVFFYDLLDGNGPDIMPKKEDTLKTLNRVVDVIVSENPDVIMLQEVDVGSKRTYYENQVQMLLEKLKKFGYIYYTDAYYWKSKFVPHPKILGAVGMKLVIFSKYPILKAYRYQLPLMEADILTKQFNFKRAILEAVIDFGNGNLVSVMDTHLDAFAQGSDTMKKQIAYVNNLLSKKEKKGEKWLIGGDFNLLPPGGTEYNALPDAQKAYFNKDTEIKILFDRYNVLPNYDDLNGKDFKKWYTHFPNDPAVKAPDRTIDYIFYSKELKLLTKKVRSSDTLDISDHLPVIAEFSF